MLFYISPTPEMTVIALWQLKRKANTNIYSSYFTTFAVL